MIHVIKATGQAEKFSEEKLVQSIKRAGISPELENEVVAHIKTKLYDDIPTSVIYHHINEYLKHSSKPYTSAKYSLKQAIMDLGPTGYPFEDYISHIMKSQGFQTSVRNIVRGMCVSHEIDVIALRGEEKIMVEAKFHNFAGTKTNIHVAMYTKARFEDIKKQNGFTHAWLVTNTKVTADAISFGGCCGMHIISWEYPSRNNFRDIVEKAKLIPITALTSLNRTQKTQLLELGIVLVKDIVSDHTLLTELHLPSHRNDDIVKESNQLLEV